MHGFSRYCLKNMSGSDIITIDRHINQAITKIYTCIAKFPPDVKKTMFLKYKIGKSSHLDDEVYELLYLMIDRIQMQGI